jgi:hypothetical protein
MARLAIDDADWAERARLRCPKGHGWWEASGTAWYCRTCGRTYDEFLDTKTGEWVAPDEVRLTDGHRQR